MGKFAHGHEGSGVINGRSKEESKWSRLCSLKKYSNIIFYSTSSYAI